MSKRARKNIMWCAGLSSNASRLIEEHGAYNSQLCNAGADFSSFVQKKNEKLAVIWLSLDSWQNLSEERREELGYMPKILVLPENVSLEELDAVGAAGFSAILREPLAAAAITSAASQAIEHQNICNDVHHMAQEIMLERELFTRKNMILEFLVDFLSATSVTLQPKGIILAAREKIATLLPVMDMGALIYPDKKLLPEDSNEIPVMFVPGTPGAAETKTWEDALKNAAKNIMELPAKYESEFLPRFCDLPHAPCKATSLVLPLQVKDEKNGIVLVSLENDSFLSRDRMVALESAMSHLGMVLRNAWLHGIIKHRSEVDSLTKIYNRRYFDQMLSQEVARHSRYELPLSLLVFDIDNFKRFNDTFGHVMGDEILQEFAAVIGGELRSTDYLARYGGEEFAAILPHTNGSKAYELGERLRQKIESHVFCSGKLCQIITSSIGVSTLLDSCCTERDMLEQADVALYNAKSNGRNRTAFNQTFYVNKLPLQA